MESIMVAVMARSGNHYFVHVEQRRWSIKECKTYKIGCNFSLALRSNVKLKTHDGSNIGINIAHGWVTGVMIVLLKATTPIPAMTHPS